ncbi:MAG: hypothetical protein UH850_14920 [Paludibacteraceae bacterium]|nr:hypothetical protein [Paludibacteraceae bacterium]
MATISDIKEELLKDSNNIVSLLERYDFCHINLRPGEIRFARSHEGGRNISIRLQHNEWLNVADFARGYIGDIFSFIAQERNVTFREVLLSTKKILGLSDDWRPRKQYQLFNGIYSGIGKNAKLEAKIYDESIMAKYPKVANLRFLRDHISIESQLRFSISYNVETQRILIPIRNIYGDLCGIKARRNYDTDNPDDPKYIYEWPCAKSLLLYGAHENYTHLMNADKIVIGESEKFVLACDSYGYNSAISIMGSTLSSEQAKILLGFNAKEYCFMMDEGLDPKIIYNNAKLLKSFAAMRECKITFFNWQNSLSVGEKESPTDNGKETFYHILETEIEPIENLEEEDEI